MSDRRRISLALLALTLAAAAATPRPAAAQQLDRNVIPTPGPSPVLRVPAWTKETLANGATLVVIEKHDLPLVACNIDFIGGATSYEPADKHGAADFAASMLSEGTATRTADQLSDAQQLLGTEIETSVSPETGTIRFTSLRDKFEPALALAADMMLNSRFPDSALERIRARTLVQLTQERDEPDAIASKVFATLTYGSEHPYGRRMTEQGVKAITRNDVVSFAKGYYEPGRAIITVSGDIDAKTARAAVEKALAAWKSGGSRPSFTYPAVPAPKSRTIYLVDKPGAAQSVFAFGTPGPSRATPDFYSLRLMNTILGELFQSRLNHDVREVKGFSYGVGSNFEFGRGPGAFLAGGDIVSAKSDSALTSFMTDLAGVQGSVPFTDDEMMQGKQALIQSLPGRFSSVNRVAAAVSSLYLQDLPETYYRDFAKNVNALSPSDLVRVAKKYIDLDHLNMVIVGDRASIAASLEKTGVAPIVMVDVDGKPVTIP